MFATTVYQYLQSLPYIESVDASKQQIYDYMTYNHSLYNPIHIKTIGFTRASAIKINRSIDDDLIKTHLELCIVYGRFCELMEYQILEKIQEHSARVLVNPDNFMFKFYKHSINSCCMLVNDSGRYYLKQFERDFGALTVDNDTFGGVKVVKMSSSIWSGEEPKIMLIDNVYNRYGGILGYFPINTTVSPMTFQQMSQIALDVHVLDETMYKLMVIEE